jgi:hypothetical protein
MSPSEQDETGSTGADPSEVQSNLAHLASLPPSEITARLIEKIAIQNPDPAVREQAFRLLAAEPYDRIVRGFSSMQVNARLFFIAELRRLAADGLIPDHISRVIINRYEAIPSAAPAAAAQPVSADQQPDKRKQPSLAQVLLSDTTLKVALFLGAFFVVVAAFILAALVEVARFPILLFLTGAFFGGAYFLKSRIPLASFILFLAGTALIPIVAKSYVFPDSSSAGLIRYYWPVVWLITTAVLIFGTWAYRSRLLLSASFLTGGYCFGLWIWTGIEEPHILLFALGLWGLAALVISDLLWGWDNQKRLDQHLFWEAQLWQVFVFGASLLYIFIEAVEYNPSSPIDTQAAWISALWILGAAHYLLSDRFSRRQGRRLWWQIPFTLAILPIPTMLASIWLPSNQVETHLLIIWIWGVVLALAAEAVGYFLPKERLYALFLRIPLPLVFLTAVLGEAINESPERAVRYLAGAGMVFGLLAIRRTRWIFSTLSLLFLYLAYIWQHSLWAEELRPAVVETNFYFFYPVLLLLTANLILRKTGRAYAWQIGSLAVGGLAAVIHLGLLLDDTGRDYAAVMAILLTYTAYSLAYAVIDRRSWLVYFSASYAVLGVLRWITEQSENDIALVLASLALLFYLAGIWLESRQGEAVAYGKAWRISGLGYGVLVTLIALTEATPTATIAPALAASAFAIEAFRRKNVWLGYPANALYFCAYIIGLGNLEVNEPQFYSIGAALLGRDIPAQQARKLPGMAYDVLTMGGASGGSPAPGRRRATRRAVDHPARRLDAFQRSQGGAQHGQLPGGITGLAQRAPQRDIQSPRCAAR